MKTYTFKLVITEGSDEFWEDLNERGVTGCEELQQMIEDGLCQLVSMPPQKKVMRF